MTSTTSTILILLQLSSLILLTSTRRVPASTEEGGTQEESNEFVLDLKTVNGDPDNLMAQIKHLASALQTCGFSGEMQHMRLFQLTNQSVTCNDGTPAGYYFRRSQGSKKWLIYLEGGWHCYDRDSCHNRWQTSSKLMSSRSWLKTKTGTGILSPDPEENPVFWKSNVVYVPYCSSDVWSGTAPASEPGGYAFMGALILNEIFKELLGIGLLDARQVVFAGSSAGGTGVMLNLDRASAMLAEAGSSAQVLGLIDSGWFLDQEQQTPIEQCRFVCNPAMALQLGTKLWNSIAPKTCLEMYGEENKWKCFFGFRIHETLQTPVFIFQWLYDEAQLMVGMSEPPIQIEHWNFMQKTGRDMRASLRNTSAVFAPACYAHMILTKSDWTSIQVRNVRLHKALQCWLKKNEPEEQVLDFTKEAGVPLFGVSKETEYSSEYGSGHPMTTAPPPTTAEDEEEDESGGGGWWPWKRSAETTERQTRLSKKRNGRKPGQIVDREMQGDDPGASAKRPTPRKKKRCQLRLLDHATCPHCNPTCPKKINPYTGEDIEFLSFMRLMGLDLTALAQQMGLDERALSMVSPAEALVMIAEAARN
ncbi:palmitoleoyl-protein carboxylesterase notum1-like isoform X1 [Asterias amurensis]|uniref:palmitoleoyl-protein carboxylesterase notum1-like isoform X1 n=1 Tax=Asterias amurensis TaxID=7602 RepID=UPI003AB536BC